MTYRDLNGILGDSFGFDGGDGNRLKNESDGLSVRDSDDSSLKNLKTARASDNEHVSTFLDSKEFQYLIEFSFNGGSPPSAGANTGKYGLCHTSGGLYNAGNVYYDDGSSLVLKNVYKGYSTIISTVAVSGTISFIANGIYVAQSASAPYSWTLKGDYTGANTGIIKRIKIVIGINSSYSSTTTIPTGSKVTQVSTNITSAYDNSATIQVVVDGTTDLTIQGTNFNKPHRVDNFINEPYLNVASANTGPVKINIANSPTVGAGEVEVTYVESYLS